MRTLKKLQYVTSIAGLLMLVSLAATAAKADPLTFSNVSALQNSGFTSVPLFSSSGITLVGPQLSFTVDVTGTLPMGGTDTIRLTYTELGSPPQVQEVQIPVFGSIQPPFTLLFTFVSPGANAQGILATLTVDLLNSSPDFVIPSGPNQGQQVNSHTFNFIVTQPVPEPVTLFGFAVSLAAVFKRRRR